LKPETTTLLSLTTEPTGSGAEELKRWITDN
jgi:hypothetical protein